MTLKNNLEKIWTIKQFKEWEYLFRSNENDTNLYFVISWKIILKNNEEDIAFIQENELLWEKSFLNKAPKPIDAKIIADSKIIIITNENYNKISEKEKNELLSDLMIYISTRVDMLNNIMFNIKSIAEKIYKYSWGTNNDNIKKIFENIYQIDNFLILKNEYGTLSRIAWDMFLEKDVEDMITLLKPKKLNFISDNDKILFLVTKDYIYFMKWKKILWSYIVNNVFLYLKPVFHMFAEKLENIKNKDIQDNIMSY